jgi:hypothetical protein
MDNPANNPGISPKQMEVSRVGPGRKPSGVPGDIQNEINFWLTAGMSHEAIPVINPAHPTKPQRCMREVAIN